MRRSSSHLVGILLFGDDGSVFYTNGIASWGGTVADSPSDTTAKRRSFPISWFYGGIDPNTESFVLKKLAAAPRP